MAGKLNLNSGCGGNTGLDGRIQILFSRHEYSSPQGRLSYNNKPLIPPAKDLFDPVNVKDHCSKGGILGI